GTPAPPTSVRADPLPATSSTGALKVSFAPASGNGSPITHYAVTCTSAGGGAAKTASAAAGPINVSGTTTAKSYTCTVRPTSAKRTSAAPDPSPATIVGSPAAPSGVKAVKIAAGSLKVSFGAGAANGSAITAFTATCASKNGGATKSKSGMAGPITVTSLTPG